MPKATLRRILLLFLAVLLLAGADLLAGDAGFSRPEAVIFLKLRLPRMLTALTGGASLALAGLQMQSVFRNPLADPHILGVSAGAGTGAAVATLLLGSLAGLSGLFAGLTLVSAAFLGALLSTLLILAVSARIRNATTLLIFGVMLGFVFSAFTSVLEYSAGKDALKLFYSWSAGSFTGSRPGEVALLAGLLLLGSLLAVSQHRRLDLLLFGDEYAALSGARPARIRSRVLLGACLLTGGVTAFCGPLGFVGIVSPHIARVWLGTAVHRTAIPASLLVGASLGLLADLLSQAFPAPLPVGSTLALIGIPLILLILVRRT